MVFQEHFSFKETGGGTIYIKKENHKGNKQYAYFLISEDEIKNTVESFLKSFHEKHIDKKICPSIKNLVLLDRFNNVMDNT